MIVVNNLESSVTPLPYYVKKGKKESQTVSQPKPKIQGLEASGALPQKRKNPKSKKTSPQTPTIPPNEKVPTDDSDKTQSVSSGQTAHPQDTEGNKQPADMGLPTTHPDEGISTTKPLLEGTNTRPKDSGRLKPLADKDSSTSPVTVLSRTDDKYQVDQTQSTRFEVSIPNQHQSKTSSSVELDSEPLKLTTMADIQALLIDSED
ncbi:hypothetical protein Tco_0845358 [Tanacetum coccineum]